MHMEPALFQKANAGRHVTGDEGASLVSLVSSKAGEGRLVE